MELQGLTALVTGANRGIGRAIAEELVITQAAVKQHLAHLYDKFGIAPAHAHRRAALANEALRRGAVSLSELRQSSPSSS